MRNKDFVSAAGAFQRAAALRENDFLLWLRLGYSLSQSGDFDGAEAAYHKALQLAPNYGQPNYYMGMMLLDAGRREEAFLYLGRAADRDHELYPQMLHQARMAFPDDPITIENSFQPDSTEARKIVARYLIKHGFMTDAVRSFLTSDELLDSEKNEFIQYLLHKENFKIAREVWLSRLKIGEVARDEPIFDGGFETITENDPSGLGWQVDQRISATAVARSARKSHSGTNSLQIKFAGNVELGRNIVSQIAYVEPGKRYVLYVSTLSPELISAGLPSIVISNAVTNEIIAKSAELQPTEDRWVEFQCEFVSAEPVVRVGLQRTNCNTSPCPIFGELFLDDFHLTERPAN